MKSARAARTASPAMSERIECDAIANFEAAHADSEFDDFARGFMSQHERDAPDHPIRAEFPIDDVQVGAAYAASADPHEQFAFADFRNWSVDYFDAGRRTGFCDCFHLIHSESSIRLGSVLRQRDSARAVTGYCQCRAGAPR